MIIVVKEGSPSLGGANLVIYGRELPFISIDLNIVTVAETPKIPVNLTTNSFTTNKRRVRCLSIYYLFLIFWVLRTSKNSINFRAVKR
jgi:hypothetical protein